MDDHEGNAERRPVANDRNRRWNDRARAPETADLAQISKLRDAGIDVARPRDMKHILAFDTLQTARFASELLRAAGHAVIVSRASEGPGWWVSVSVRHEIDVERIGFFRSALETYARDFDGDYLGWGPGADVELADPDSN